MADARLMRDISKEQVRPRADGGVGYRCGVRVWDGVGGWGKIGDRWDLLSLCKPNEPNQTKPHIQGPPRAARHRRGGGWGLLLADGEDPHVHPWSHAAASWGRWVGLGLWLG